MRLPLVTVPAKRYFYATPDELNNDPYIEGKKLDVAISTHSSFLLWQTQPTPRDLVYSLQEVVFALNPADQRQLLTSFAGGYEGEARVVRGPPLTSGLHAPSKGTPPSRRRNLVPLAAHAGCMGMPYRLRWPTLTPHMASEKESTIEKNEHSGDLCQNTNVRSRFPTAYHATTRGVRTALRRPPRPLGRLFGGRPDSSKTLQECYRQGTKGEQQKV